MIAYILLRGKDFTLPDEVSTAIVGVFFGLVCGLFYYQHYYRNYYWWFSIGGGLILTFISQKVIDAPTSEDSSVVRTIASFLVPFVLTLLLNQALYFVKHSKRRRRKTAEKKTHSDLFNSMPSALPHRK